MKTSKLYFITFSFLALLMVGCSDKKSQELTSIVDYVVLKLEGPSQVTLSLGDTYVEEGFTATDKGVNVEDKVKITITNMIGEEVDAVTTDAPGIFTITYSAISQDKMPISVSRQVLVFDPNLSASIDGSFDVDFAKSARIDGSRDWTWQQWSDYYTNPENWAQASYSMKKIEITFSEIVPGIYECSDFLGGFYAGLRGYAPYYVENNGPSYENYFKMEGMVILNSDLSLNLVSSYIPAWGDGLEDFAGTLDDQTNTLDIHSVYGGGMDFNVVMTLKK